MALNEDKIIVDVEVQVDDSKLNSDLKSINKQVQDASKDSTLNVGVAIDKDATDKVDSIKRALRALKEEAASVGEGGVGFEKLTRDAGELQKKLDDVNDQMKVSSQDGLNKFGAQLGLIKNKLLDLDFSGARKGIEGLGSTVLRLGPATTAAGAGFRTLAGAIAATGIGALVIAVGYLVTHFDEIKNSTGLIGQKIRELTTFFEGLVDKAKVFIEGAVNGFIDLYNKSILVRGVIQGFILYWKTFVDGVVTGAKIVGNAIGSIGSAILDIFKGKNPLDSLKQGFADIEKNLSDFKTNFKTNFADAVDSTLNGQLKPVSNLFGSFSDGAKKEGKKAGKEFKEGFEEALVETQPDDVLNFNPFENSGIKSKAFYSEQISQLERVRDNISLGSAEWIRYGELIDILKQKVMELESIETPIQKKKKEDQKEYNDLLKESDEIFSGLGIKIPEISQTIQQSFTEWQENNKEELGKAAGYLSQLSDAVGQVGDVIQGIFEIRINRAENAADREIAALQRTFDMATKGKNLSNAQQVALENKLAQDKYKVSLELFNKEEKLRERAFKANKAIQIVQAVIGTAQGIIAALAEPGGFPLMIARMVLAATTGAIQIGVIASQQFPKGEAPSAPSPISVPEPNLPDQNTNVQGPDRSFQAAQFFGLGGKQAQDSNSMMYQKVYVVESDITQSQRQVNVIEERATFR